MSVELLQLIKNEKTSKIENNLWFIATHSLLLKIIKYTLNSDMGARKNDVVCLSRNTAGALEGDGAYPHAA